MGTFVASQSFQYPIRCEPPAATLAMGHQFLKMYFAEFADKSGKISLTSGLTFDQAKAMFLAVGAKEKQCRAMWDLMDTDGSGTIDFCEIMVYFIERGKGTLQEKSALFFHACDIDNSGTIEAEELKTVIHHMMMLMRERDGIGAFTAGQTRLYAGIPGSYILHFQANEMVNDIFSGVTKGNSITEKQFQAWLSRGGKQCNKLLALFGV